MLIQTDKFGTSVAQSLRVYSETLRTKRRQRAEEAAAKTGVKMVFPLVFCIFPAIWVVTIGPAAIRFVTVLFPMIENIEIDAVRHDDDSHGADCQKPRYRRDRRRSTSAVADTRADARRRPAVAQRARARRGAVDRAEPRRAHLVACASPSTCVALDERGRGRSIASRD